MYSIIHTFCLWQVLIFNEESTSNNNYHLTEQKSLILWSTLLFHSCKGWFNEVLKNKNIVIRQICTYNLIKDKDRSISRVSGITAKRFVCKAWMAGVIVWFLDLVFPFPCSWAHWRRYIQCALIKILCIKIKYTHDGKLLSLGAMNSCSSYFLPKGKV